MKNIIIIGIIAILLVGIGIAQLADDSMIKDKLFNLYSKMGYKDIKTEDFEVTKDYTKGVIEIETKSISIKDKFAPEKEIEVTTETTYSYPRIDYQFQGHNATILGTFN